MKKIFIIIICTVAALILGYGIKYAVTPVSSQEVERATHEHMINAKGYIVREELAYYADRSGKLYKNVSVGARVSKDSILYTIYDGDVSDERIKELNTLDKKINQTREEKYAEAYDSASISVESEIASRTAQIIKAARENNVSKISNYKQDINSLRKQGTVISSDDRLRELEMQKRSLEMQLGGSKGERYAESSGVFTTYSDGYEEFLREDKLQEYTVGYLESLEEPQIKEAASDIVSHGDFVCSVVNNHVWSVLLIVNTNDIKDIKTGKTLTLRFNNIAGEEKKGTVKYISTEEQNKDGKSFIVVECEDYFEGAFSYRTVDVDIIFKRYSGYKVPVQAVRTDGNGYKVIGIVDNKQLECKVDVLYSDTEEEYVIVDSTDDAKYKVSNMDRIVVGER